MLGDFFLFILTFLCLCQRQELTKIYTYRPLHYQILPNTTFQNLWPKFQLAMNSFFPLLQTHPDVYCTKIEFTTKVSKTCSILWSHVSTSPGLKIMFWNVPDKKVLCNYYIGFNLWVLQHEMENNTVFCFKVIDNCFSPRIIHNT